MVMNESVWMCRKKVDELGDGFSSGLGAFSLSRCKSAKSYQEGQVDGAGIVKEGADDFLETCDAIGVQRSDVSAGGVS